MNNKKDGLFSKLLQSKTNRTIIIIVEVAALLTVTVLTCAVLSGNVNLSKEETTKYVLQSTTEPATIGFDDWFAEGQASVLNNNTTPFVTNPQTGNTAGFTGNTITGTNSNSNSQTVTLSDPSGWSQAQILSKATDAVNKTKGYRNNLTVNHKESFDATVTECTGGAIVQSVANAMVGWVVKPVDETLNYTNGQAVNSEGETVPIILPQRNSFYLSSDGVKSASAKISNNEYVIKINLVQENVGMNEVPRHNASAIGYLDVANFDLSFLTVESAQINYKGSSVELHINAEGYVTYAEYHIPLNIKGSGNGAGISGSVTFDGEQTEIWRLNY